MPTSTEGLAFLEENSKKEGVVVRPSGLQYKVMREAPIGSKSPKSGTPCDCHYRGTLIDGTEFDNSYKRHLPATFKPSEVVRGWAEALQLMGQGDRWQLWLPSEIGYGDQQHWTTRGEEIPPSSVLVFDLELLSVDGSVAAGTAKQKRDPADEPKPPPHVTMGARVMVTGLAARPELNGQLGTVVSWDSEKGRAGVKLDSGDGFVQITPSHKGLNLQPSNLLPAESEPDE